GEKLAFEIERTRSRLLEMKSDEYLHSEHRHFDAIKTSESIMSSEKVAIV
ncbi:hypothetical protein ACHBZG_19420, partial [Acinetobacter baumannii]